MTFLEAARDVLGKAEEPLTTGKVFQRALDRGLIGSRGSTPVSTMSAVLYGEARRKGARVRRLAEEGSTRALRGSVRWIITDAREHSTREDNMQGPSK